MIAQGVAQNQKEILRLRLGLKDEHLPLLPWEVLHDGARPLATNTDIVFSRYRSNNSRTANAGEWQLAADTEHPLRILMVLAAPTDQEVLQLHQEAQHLKQELQREVPGSDGPNLELSILDQPGREQLTQALEHGNYDILHYAGHSDLSVAGGDLYLVSDKTGLTEVLSGDDLAGLLVNNGVRMAVFNSCQGVYSANASEHSASTGSLADALLKRNVPAVLAMAEQIPDEVALNLSRLFYRNLKQRCPIDLSLARARQGLLSSYGSDQLYWALPILYMHSEFEGYLQHSGQRFQPGIEDDRLGADDLTPLLEPDDLEDWPSISPVDDQDKIQQLIAEVETGGSANGMTGITAVPPLDPKIEAIEYHRLGQQLMVEGKTLEALEAYGAAIRLNPEFAAAYYDMGQTFEQREDFNEAITAYKMALTYAPEMQEAVAGIQRLKGIFVSPSPVSGPIPDAQTTLPPPPTPPSNDVVYAPTVKSGHQRQAKLGGLTNGKTLAMAAATVAVVGSVWFLASRPQNQPDNQPSLADAPITNNTETQELNAIAMESFSQGDLRRGTESVEQLLNSGQLIAAQNALTAVAPKNIDSPIVLFLKGRLAWESLKRSEPTNYSINDVSRLWRSAVQEQPNNAYYRSTYAFGLFSDRALDQARTEWKQVATQLANEKDTAENQREKLTAYVGEALVLLKQYEKSGEQEQDKLKGAIALRDQVLRAAPNDFAPDQLLQNDWRWTADSIATWRKLLAAKR